MLLSTDGEVVELVYGTSLENWRRFIAYRGFESHPLRHLNKMGVKLPFFIFWNREHLEIYPSGWRGRFAKPLGLRKWPRGFKSLNLRQRTDIYLFFFFYELKEIKKWKYNKKMINKHIIIIIFCQNGIGI